MQLWPDNTPPPVVHTGPMISEKEYEFIRQLVYQHSRINLGPNKKELVMARLSKRLRACNLPSFKAYCDYLQSPSGEEELGNLIDAISTNHTFFFRENVHFEFLVNTVLPELAKTSQQFRVWSAASSSGEEPYSIAISLAESLGLNNRWHVECSDISSKVLQKASDGIFAEDRVSKMPQNLLKTYFQKGQGRWEGYYRVKPQLRQNLTFQLLNLMDPSFPFREPFQVIFCRNVMIYFDRPTQEDLVNRLARYIVPGGYLMIGHAESLTGIKHPLKMIKPAIYKKP